jgi:hypothetical protein
VLIGRFGLCIESRDCGVFLLVAAVLRTGHRLCKVSEVPDSEVGSISPLYSVIPVTLQYKFQY